MPALVEIEPSRQHQIGLLGEAISVRVGKNKFAMVVQEDLKYAVVDIGVAG